jgi:hypothetical protein
VTEQPEPDAAVACRLDAQGVARRSADLGALMRRALVAHERDGRGVGLTFDRSQELDAALADWVAAEKVCCPFFDFEVSHDAATTVLKIEAPDAARALIDRIDQRACRIVAARLGENR